MWVTSATSARARRQCPMKCLLCKCGLVSRLKRHNPYYQEVEWSEKAATAWEAADVVIGVVREADHEDGQALSVSQRCFQSWMEHARSEALLVMNRTLRCPDLWGDPTVPLGLMIGACVVVVAILYAPPGLRGVLSAVV